MSAAEIGEAGPADEVGREPALGGGGERLVGQVGPFLPLGPAQEPDPLAPLRQGLRPRPGFDAERRDPAGERPRGLLGRRNPERALGEDERTVAAHRAGAQRPGGPVEDQLLPLLDPRRRRPRRRPRPRAGRPRGCGTRPRGRSPRRPRGTARGRGASEASTAAARPFAITNSPSRPRARAMRSGKASATSGPTGTGARRAPSGAAAAGRAPAPSLPPCGARRRRAPSGRGGSARRAP